MRDLIDLFEAGAGLSRIVAHTRGAFGVISAFRGGSAERKVNLQRTVDMLHLIRGRDLGGVKLVGHWVENANTPEEKMVEELSYLISSMGMPHAEFENFIISLGKKFEQEAVLLGDSKTVVNYNCVTGDRDVIGAAGFIRRPDLGDFFSEVKHRPFTFGFPSA